MRIFFISFSILFFAFLGNASLAQNNSELWGEAGELWDQSGRLPDFSFAGYHSGEQDIPSNISVVVNVNDFGAKGDGVTNDLQAFKNAINAAENGAVLVPKGKYIIDGLLNIEKSNIVLRGEGDAADGTILYFTKTLTQILGGTNNEPWRFGFGGLLWIGKTWGSSLGGFMSNIADTAVRGTNILKLDDASGLEEGQFIVVKMSNPSDHSLLFHVHNDIVGNSDYSSFTKVPFEWPVQIKAINGNQIVLVQKLRIDIKMEWEPKIYTYTPNVEETGVENIRIVTPDHEYRGHHQEIGFNGLTFHNTFNCWAKNVSVQNAENGISLKRSKFCQLSNIKIYGGRRAPIIGPDKGIYGHHSICLYENSADNLITEFYIYDKYWHEVTVSHYCNGNVIRRGMGYDLSLDHHKYAPYENLFTNLNMGLGLTPWVSSGDAGAGPHTAARETFWNLRSSSWEITPTTPNWGFIQSNVIPASFNNKTDNREWYENIEDLEPKDLYVSQQTKRLSTTVADKSLMAPFIYPKAGQYEDSIKIMIFALSADEEIRYTTDGSEPDENSRLYTTPFTLNMLENNYLLKVKTFKGSGTSQTACSLFELDNISPEIANVEVMMANQLKVIFTEPVDTLSSETAANYLLNNDIGVKSCEIFDFNAVTLYLDNSFSDSMSYKLTVNNVTDIVGNPIKENSGYTFSYKTISFVASSFQEGNPPQNSFDKKLNTRWSAQGIGEWIKFDLGEIKLVDYVNIAFFVGNERNTFFSVEVSEDNYNWTEVYDGMSSGITLQLEKFSFSPVNARYVKIIGKGNNSSNPFSVLWMSVTEIEIHSQSITTYAENIRKPNLKIYPNPVPASNACVTITGFNTCNETWVEVYNISGKMVCKKQIVNDIFAQKQLSISRDALSKGIYFVKISTPGLSEVKKIIFE